MNHTILVVEDDSDLQELIRLAGEKRGYSLAHAVNGLQAKDFFFEGNDADIIILDINMPGMDGMSFCRWLRDEYPKIPVIFLSARAEEYDKIVALEIGGDDYLTKPFSMKELFTRIKVCLRRIELFKKNNESSEHSRTITLNDVSMDMDLWSCHYLGKEVLLTVSEFRILQKLLSNPEIVMTRDRLAQAAFPEDQYNTGRSIDIHIHRIRQKLQIINPDFELIETVYQVGYKWKK